MRNRHRNMGILSCLVAYSVASTASAEVASGVETGGIPRDDLGSSVSFEPASLFLDTRPATTWIYKGSGIKKMKGGGAVVASASWSITGLDTGGAHLGLNCEGSYADGTVPQLPQTIGLSNKNSSVSLKVGTTLDYVGRQIKITAKGGGDPQVVALTDTLQTVVFNGSGIKKITIEDNDPAMPACIVAIDELTFTPE